MQCFLCKKNNFETVYSLKSKKIIRCKNDGLFFAQEINKLEKIYGRKYFDVPPHPPNANKKYFLKKLRLIQSFTSRIPTQSGEGGPTILDVGCGWGDFLEVLKKENIDYKGIDNSAEAISICRSKNLNCQKISLQDLAHDNKTKYDAITFFQVIEHIKYPIPVLTAAEKLLKPNGLILITTPNNDSHLRKIFGSNWSVYHEKSHFVFYNKNTLLQVLNLAGFNKIKVRTDSMRFLSLKYILNKLNFEIGKLEIENWKLKINSLSVPTDPFGDLEAFAFHQ